MRRYLGMTPLEAFSDVALPQTYAPSYPSTTFSPSSIGPLQVDFTGANKELLAPLGDYIIDRINRELLKRGL
jgi:hypothetical protein